jgi:outer membrane protein insertion porin family
LSIKINVEEGNIILETLSFRKHPDQLLSRIVGVKKKKLSNGEKKRIASQNQTEKITNLYQNNGYLFSNINAVEVKTVNDIDFEIRVNEGPLAYFNKITVVGKTKQMIA